MGEYQSHRFVIRTEGNQLARINAHENQATYTCKYPANYEFEGMGDWRVYRKGAHPSEGDRENHRNESANEAQQSGPENIYCPKGCSTRKAEERLRSDYRSEGSVRNDRGN